MTTQEFELKLKEIDPKFSIVPHPTSPELAGVYYDRNEENRTGFIITVPSDYISEEFDPKHRDPITQHVHNWAAKVIHVCKDHLQKMETNADYKSLFYEKLGK